MVAPKLSVIPVYCIERRLFRRMDAAANGVGGQWDLCRGGFGIWQHRNQSPLQHWADRSHQAEHLIEARPARRQLINCDNESKTNKAVRIFYSHQVSEQRSANILNLSMSELQSQ